MSLVVIGCTGHNVIPTSSETSLICHWLSLVALSVTSVSSFKKGEQRHTFGLATWLMTLPHWIVIFYFRLLSVKTLWSRLSQSMNFTFNKGWNTSFGMSKSPWAHSGIFFEWVWGARDYKFGPFKQNLPLKLIPCYRNVQFFILSAQKMFFNWNSPFFLKYHKQFF